MFTHYGNMFAGGQRMMGASPFGMDGFGGFALLPLIGFIVLAAIVAAVVIWTVARKRPSTGATPGAIGATTAMPASSGDAALSIARERLARGEIEPEQYTAIVAALNGQPTAQPAQG